VKHIAHVTSCYSSANDTDDYNISYDIQTLERDFDVDDMFRWRTNGGDPLYLFFTSDSDDE